MEAQRTNKEIYNEIFYYFANNGFHTAFFPEVWNKIAELEIIVSQEIINRKLTKVECDFISKKHAFLKEQYGGIGYSIHHDDGTKDWVKIKIAEFKANWENNGKVVPPRLLELERAKNRH